MGKQLKAIYNEIKEKYGQIGLYRLVVKVKISPKEVEKIPDDPDVIHLVISAIEELGLSTDMGIKAKKRKGFLSRLFRRKENGIHY